MRRLLIICAATLALLGRVAAQEPKPSPTADDWQKRGLSQYLQNQFAPASQSFQQALKLDQKLWPSHLFLGICRYRLNDFPAALASLQESDRLAPAAGPGRDDILYWLGAAHIALRSPLAGLAALERLLARNPAHVAALQLATETYAESASMLWNSVAEQAFSSSAGQEVHGTALESEGNRPGALKAFQEAVRLAPQRPGPGAAMARLHLLTGALDEAAAAVARELKLDPASPEANLYAGLLAVARQSPQDAVAPLQRAAQWLPDNDEPLLALTQVYLSLREADKAVGVARQAVALDAQSTAAHELLLSAFMAAGDEPGVAAERLRWQSRH